MREVESEFGSSFNVRFMTALESKEITCIDCEAKSHLFSLYDLQENDPKAIEKMKNVLIWILENIEWPVLLENNEKC